MPCNVEVWVDDSPDHFTVYIDKKLITKRGAAFLEDVLRKHIQGWKQIDALFVRCALQAIAG